MSKTNIEIHAQFEALKKTCALLESKKAEAKAFFEAAAPAEVIAIGCGSSFQLSESIAMSTKLHLSVSATAIPGGDLMIHMDQYAPLFKNRPMIVTVSRSGSTSEVLYAVTKLKEQYPELKVVCIACTENSVIAQKSDFVIELPWAFDESVCQTRSVTNLYAAAMLFIGACAGEEEVFESYKALAEGGDAFIAGMEDTIKEIAALDFASAAVIADKEGFGIAEEASLAFNEICYTPSTYKHVLDLRHGPIVLFNSKTLAILKLDNDEFNYQKALAADVLARGAILVVVSDEEIPAIEGARAQFCFGKKLHPMASGCVLLPVAQLLSYHHALAVNADPDQPDGLDAWIELK